MQPLPIPRIEFCKVVLAESVPRRARPGAGEWLLVEWWSDVAIRLPHHRVVIAAAVVPQAVVMIESCDAVCLHAVCELLEIIGESRANAARHEARDRRPNCCALRPGESCRAKMAVVLAACY